MTDPLPWLLQAEEPWVRWGALRLARPDDVDAIEATRRETLADPRVRALIDEVVGPAWPPMTNHKQAKHPLHKAALLAELGLRARDPEGRVLAEQLMAHPAEDGPFQVLELVPKVFGGTGEPGWDWMGCDAPLVLWTVAELGLADDERAVRAADRLAALADPEGWLCHSSIGMQGPGKKTDPCPYATLISVRALQRFAAHREGEAVRAGAEMLLGHWARQAEVKLRMFGIGTDFKKAKVPFVWYDLLHVLDVLSRLPWVHDDPRFREMLDVLADKPDADGRIKPESVWMAFKGFDFAQKRGPSPTLTLAAARILRRVG